MVFSSSHDCIEITTNPQSNHRKPAKIWLNGSPTAGDTRKRPQRDWTQGRRRGTGRSRTRVRRLKTGRGFSARGPDPTPGSRPRVPVPGTEVPMTGGCGNQRRWWPSGTQGGGSPRPRLEAPRADSPLSDSPGRPGAEAAAAGAGDTREEPRCRAAGRGPGGGFLPGRSAGRGLVPSSGPPRPACRPGTGRRHIRVSAGRADPGRPAQAAP